MSVTYFIHRIREYGLSQTAGSLLQAKLGLRLRQFEAVRARVAGKRGLEVGGPSSSFKRGGILPVYDVVGSLDNCAYAADTQWAQHTQEFRFSAVRPAGTFFVSEAAALQGIHDETYDFVLSSHMIEHTANPLGALSAWWRVLVPGGTLVLLVPDKERTFDNSRATTSMEHLISDYILHTPEDDRTHVDEMLRDHNMRRTPDWTRERLMALVQNNSRTRGLHHHVFDLPLVVSMVEYVRFRPLLSRRALPNHLLVMAEKPLASAQAGGALQGL